jgi:hypothetical protein
VADNYEADDDGAVIRVDPASGAKAMIAQGGLLDLPFDLLVDLDGSLVVSNRVLPGSCGPAISGRLVRVAPADGSQQLVSGGGLFSYPLGVALDGAGTIVFANECGEPGLGRVVSETAQSVLTTNNGSDVLATPERLALDPAGDFVVSDWSLGDGDGGIVKVDADTGAQSLVGAGELFNHPMGIAAVVNRPPIAALKPLPSLVAAGQRVALDASASLDPEGLRLLYEWDLNGDGVFELGTGAAPSAIRAWRRNGPVTVRVRVNDPHGGRAVVEGVVGVDGSVPRITGLTLDSRVLSVGRGGPRRRDRSAARRAAKRPPGSAKLGFRLSEPAGVRVTVQQLRPRRRAVQARVLTKDGRTGVNTLRVSARGLRPGRYRLLIEATDAVGHDATPRRLGLRVVRRAPRGR